MGLSLPTQVEAELGCDNKCLISSAGFSFKKNGELEAKDVKVEFKRPFYPFGKCLNIVPNKNIKNIAFIDLGLNSLTRSDHG